MEVHTHTHTERKKWTHYLWEFLMLFLAVFCGFMAENWREHLVEHNREKQYMQSMAGDIRKDTIEVNTEIIYATELMHGLDSLFQCLHSKEITDSVQRRLYFLSIKYSRLIGIDFSDETSSQLKNAGGMRLIRNREVADGIAFYWKRIQLLEFDINYFNNKMNELAEVGYKIFDRAYIQNFSHSTSDGTGMMNVQINSDARLMVHDRNQLTEYANRIIVLVNSLQTWYLPTLEKQKIAASDLILLIKKEYHLK